MTDPTPAQFAAVKEQVQPPPVGTGPDPDVLAAKSADAMANETDIEALVSQMQRQMAALQAQVATLRAGQLPAGEHNAIGAAAQARDLIAHHYEFHVRGPELTRLADDLVDASRNAVDSGDPGPARQVAAKLERRLLAFHPGPGDHHYFRQALGLVQLHVPDALDTITEARPNYDAPAVSGGAPAKVLAGSVTG
jgi:hypothetical protein